MISLSCVCLAFGTGGVEGGWFSGDMSNNNDHTVSKEETSSSGSVPEHIKGTRVKMLLDLSITESELQKYLNLAENQNISVECQFTSREYYEYSLMSMVAAAINVDITVLRPSYFVQMLGYHEPLGYFEYSDVIGIDRYDWNSDVLETFKVNGNHFAVSGYDSYEDYITLFYNKNSFIKYDLNEPEDYYKQGNWNFDSFIRCIKDIQNMGDYIGFANDGKLLNYMAGSSGLDFVNYNGSVLQNNLSNIADVCSAYKYVMNYCDEPEDDALSRFKSGNAAMIALPYKAGYSSDNEYGLWDLGFSIGSAPFPSLTGGISYQSFDAYGFGITKFARNKEGAAYVLKNMFFNDSNHDNTPSSSPSSSEHENVSSSNQSTSSDDKVYDENYETSSIPQTSSENYKPNTSAVTSSYEESSNAMSSRSGRVNLYDWDYASNFTPKVSWLEGTLKCSENLDYDEFMNVLAQTEPSQMSAVLQTYQNPLDASISEANKLLSQIKGNRKITVFTNDTNYGKVSDSIIDVDDDTEVTIVATAYNGCKFLGWYENDKLVSTDSKYTFTVSKNRDLEAKFTVAVSSKEMIVYDFENDQTRVLTEELAAVEENIGINNSQALHIYPSYILDGQYYSKITLGYADVLSVDKNLKYDVFAWAKFNTNRNTALDVNIRCDGYNSGNLSFSNNSAIITDDKNWHKIYLGTIDVSESNHCDINITFYKNENSYDDVYIDDITFIARTEENKYDINCDEFTDVKDLIRLKRYIAYPKDTIVIKPRCDIDDNNVIAAGDLVLLRKRLLNVQ